MHHHASSCVARARAGELRYDPQALVLCGESAGAHIATTTLMRAVARGGPRAAVRGQVLICASIHYGYAPDKWQDYFPVCPPAPLSYSDEKVANRDARVWHWVIEKGYSLSRSAKS